MVTNNEVEEKTARQLERSKVFRGDPRYERNGIFEQVTRPRCEAVITGRLSNGKPVPGVHIGGRPFAVGFDENVEFFRLEYLDPDEVDLGNQFNAIFPSLWLASGGIGERPPLRGEPDMVLPPSQPYGILLNERKFRAFRKVVEERVDITHVWIVTDSENAFAEMKAALPPRIYSSMLYRDYLRNFTINTRQNL